MEMKTYALEAQTPLGKRRGSLTLCVADGCVSGELTLFARTTPIREGTLEGGRLTFQGEMKLLLGMLPYEACGTLRENGLVITFRTARDSYEARGVLTRNRRG